MSQILSSLSYRLLVPLALNSNGVYQHGMVLHLSWSYNETSSSVSLTTMTDASFGTAVVWRRSLRDAAEYSLPYRIAKYPRLLSRPLWVVSRDLLSSSVVASMPRVTPCSVLQCSQTAYSRASLSSPRPPTPTASKYNEQTLSPKLHPLHPYNIVYRSTRMHIILLPELSRF